MRGLKTCGELHRDRKPLFKQTLPTCVFELCRTERFASRTTVRQGPCHAPSRIGADSIKSRSVYFGCIGIHSCSVSCCGAFRSTPLEGSKISILVHSRLPAIQRTNNKTALFVKTRSSTVSELCQNPLKLGKWRSVLSEEQIPQVIVFSRKSSEKVERKDRVFVRPRQVLAFESH